MAPMAGSAGGATQNQDAPGTAVPSASAGPPAVTAAGTAPPAGSVSVPAALARTAKLDPLETLEEIRSKTIVSASANSVAHYIFNIPLTCMVWWGRYKVRSVVFFVFEDAEVRERMHTCFLLFEFVSHAKRLMCALDRAGPKQAARPRGCECAETDAICHRRPRDDNAREGRLRHALAAGSHVPADAG